MASDGISPLLAMEESAPRGSSVSIFGNPQSDPANEPRQPALGSSSHSWRIVEDWNSDFSSNRHQIHGETEKATLPDLAHLSQKPRQGIGFRRFLGGTYHYVSTPFAFVILDHDRRRPVHFAVTASLTAEWTARQLLEAFPWDNAPKYLLRDRDGVYGQKFCEMAEMMGIREILTALRSPWQNAYVERLIGSIRRECLDHLIVFDEAGLRRILKDYFEYYESCHTHLSLEKDTPVSRPVEPPLLGHVIELPKDGGLHHHYISQSCLIEKDIPTLW